MNPINIAEPNLATKNQTIMSKFLFWIVAIIPAIFAVISYKYIYEFLMLIFLPVLVAFLLNLAIPVAINKRKALLFAIPASFVYFYLFPLSMFLMGVLIYLDPGDAPGGAGWYILYGVLFLILEFIFFIITTLGAWFGARLRKKLNIRHKKNSGDSGSTILTIL
jgi:hypothetical protein